MRSEFDAKKKWDALKLAMGNAIKAGVNPHIHTHIHTHMQSHIHVYVQAGVKPHETPAKQGTLLYILNNYTY